MKVYDIINEDGKIVPGVNTTVDVKQGETERQAKKFFGCSGKPKPLGVKGASTNQAFNLGLVESSDIHPAVVRAYQKTLDAEDQAADYNYGANKARVTRAANHLSKMINKHYPDLDMSGKIALRTKLQNLNENISHTAQKRIDRDKKLQPGTEEWFQNWFALPKMFKEKNVKSLREFVELDKRLVNEFRDTYDEITPNTIIYVDMDGVLADFFGEWAKLMGVSDWRDIEKQYDIKDALQKIRDTKDFWINLPMTSNAKSLLMAIREAKGSYKILSSPLPGDPNSETDKHRWVEKHLGCFPPDEVILSHEKYLLAKNSDGTPNVLIDDYGVNIAKWEQHGGIGFRHKDHKFERTARALKKHFHPEDKPKTESILEGYQLRLERGDDMDVLHITDTKTKQRTEVRGKPNYEISYDPDDKLHQLLDKIGKASNISDLINGEVVGINPKHPDGKSAKAHADKAFNEDVNIDNKDGWGSVPWNQDVEYRGMRVKMKPSVFEKLALSRGGEPAVEKVVQHIKDGGSIGAPFLQIRVDDDESQIPEVVGHEGRSRMLAILELYGDVPVETHLFFQGKVNRNRHITPEFVEKIQRYLISQNDVMIKGPLFSESAQAATDVAFNEAEIAMHKGNTKIGKNIDLSKSADGTFWLASPTADWSNIVRTGDTVDNAYEISSKAKLATWDDIDRYGTGELEAMGYDGVRMPDGDDHITYQIWNTKILKPIDLNEAAELKE